jgi:hypothetical protein
VSTTTQRNISQMRKSIEFTDLPKTFRDAVYCAQKLGIQYIWIDSLCIIQNDPQDWEVEAAKMCDVYQDAYLVIIAASAGGDTLGFLGQRPLIYQGILLESKEGTGDWDTVFRHSMPHSLDNTSSKASLTDSSTQSRAWCMQESVLASRSVSIHESEMVWECHSLLDCECQRASIDLGNAWSFQTNFEILVSGDNFFDPSHTLVYHSKPFTLFKYARSIYDEWKRMIIPLYMQRSITKVGDRLPALSGLAKLLADKLQDEYIAGLWRNDIRLGLLWSIAGEPLPELGTYIGPTFSWVSVNQAIVYELPSIRPILGGRWLPPYGTIEFDLLDADTQKSSGNIFGAVLDGHIRVRGLSQQLTLHIESDCYRVSCDDICEEPYRVKFKADSHLREVYVECGDGETIPSANRSFCNGGPDAVANVVIDSLLVMNSFGYWNDEEKGEWHDAEYAVITLGLSKTHPGAFERLGLGFLRISKEDDRRWLNRAVSREFIIV